MKVFNITDVPTTALRAQGLVKVSVKVGTTVVPPGSSREIAGTARELSELSIYLRNGALSRDALPAAYAQSRGLNLDGTPIPPPPSEEVVMEEVAEVAEVVDSGGSTKSKKR